MAAAPSVLEIETFVIFTIKTPDWPQITKKPLGTRSVEICCIPVRKNDWKEDMENLKDFEFDFETYDEFVSFLAGLPKPVCLVAHNGNSHDFKILRSKCNIAGKTLPEDLLCADSYRFFKFIHKGFQNENSLAKLYLQYTGKNDTRKQLRVNEKARMLLETISKKADEFMSWAGTNRKNMAQIKASGKYVPAAAIQPAVNPSPPAAVASPPAADPSPPDADTIKPAAAPSQPAANYSPPATDASPPAADSSPPDANTSKPAAATSPPDTDTSQLAVAPRSRDSDTSRPAAAAMPPAAAVMPPATTASQPAADASQLPTAASQLTAAASLLATAASQLATAASQLATAASKLAAAAIQLPAAASQLAAAASQPAAAPCAPLHPPQEHPQSDQ